VFGWPANDGFPSVEVIYSDPLGHTLSRERRAAMELRRQLAPCMATPGSCATVGRASEPVPGFDPQPTCQVA
jgi:hypothetical protein